MKLANMTNDTTFSNTPEVDTVIVPNDGEIPSISEETIDYDIPIVENKSVALPFVINHKFFVSHASRSSRIEPNVRPVLSGEKEFVSDLVGKLEELYPKTTYVDYRDNPDFEFNIFNHALKTSRFGIFICSPRFKDRWLNSNAPFLTDEVKHFWTLKNTHHQPDRQIPIKFGMDDFDFDTGPFSTSDYFIDAEYGTLSISRMVEKVVLEITKKMGT